MTRDFTSVSPNANIIDCSKIMIKKRVGSLVLEENKQLKGLLTERDIIWAMTKKTFEEFRNIKAGDIAKKKITTIKPSSDLFDALVKMKKSKYRWLPVTIKNQVIGFLTIKDILRINPDLFEIVHSQGGFQIKEEQEKLKRKQQRTENAENLCEECGNFGELENIDGRMICESCKDSM